MRPLGEGMDDYVQRPVAGDVGAGQRIERFHVLDLDAFLTRGINGHYLVPPALSGGLPERDGVAGEVALLLQRVDVSLILARGRHGGIADGPARGGAHGRPRAIV